MVEIVKLPEPEPHGKLVLLPTLERKRMRRMLDAGWADPSLGIVEIVGNAGLGKTETAREWVREEPGRLLITMTKLGGRPRTGLSLVADQLATVHPNGGYTVASTIFNRIDGWRDYDKHVPVMLVIDEAQHMSDDLIDELRSIKDEIDRNISSGAGVGLGMAFVGNEKSRGRLQYGKGVDHLTSRLGPRLDLEKAATESIELLARHHNVAGAGEVRRLERLARLGGNLRTVDKTLREGRRLCGDARMPLTIEEIDAAAKVLGLIR